MVAVHDDDRRPPLAQVESVGVVRDKEHMFDKVVTPSDVGKLNRLVIPKQHAEKYFPLDSSTNVNGKGLLLNFEDAIGKAWGFRYSYWNSSQSYVLTKGWSRFVKDKKLEAGDTVSFHRGVGESAKHCLYIDYTHRPGLPYHHFSAVPWSPLLMLQPIAARVYIDFSNANGNAHSYGSNGGDAGSSYCYNSSNYTNSGSSSNPGTTSYVRSPSVPQQLGMVKWQQCTSDSTVSESAPVVQGKAAAKRLRLFGVNMDCPSSDSEQCDKLSTSTGMPPYRTLAAALHRSPSFHSLPLQRGAFTLHKGYSALRLDLDI